MKSLRAFPYMRISSWASRQETAILPTTVKISKDLQEAGIKCICYNFMPVFDWTRTQLDHVLPDGSTSLVYYQEQIDQVNPLASDSDLTLPGWDASYTREELKQVVAEYNSMSEENLWII